MLRKLFQRLRGSPDRRGSQPDTVASDIYRGFTLHAQPRKDPNGWRVAGRVELTEEAGILSHDFVRADTYPGRDDAAQVSLSKARQLVDERGRDLFD